MYRELPSIACFRQFLLRNVSLERLSNLNCHRPTLRSADNPKVYTWMHCCGRDISMHREANRGPSDLCGLRTLISATTWQACASSRHSSGVNVGGRAAAGDDTAPDRLPSNFALRHCMVEHEVPFVVEPLTMLTLGMDAEGLSRVGAFLALLCRGPP